ncbi:hypothetical protein DAT36_15690 [Photobacterium phosphoreum]|nr:hypothetical protein DAT36_15690 [Photobacterium phosphoreum]
MPNFLAIIQKYYKYDGLLHLTSDINHTMGIHLLVADLLRIQRADSRSPIAFAGIHRGIYALWKKGAGYYSSSRKLRNEAIRDLFTARLSIKDASKNNKNNCINA